MFVFSFTFVHHQNVWKRNHEHCTDCNVTRMKYLYLTWIEFYQYVCQLTFTLTEIPHFKSDRVPFIFKMLFVFFLIEEKSFWFELKRNRCVCVCVTWISAKCYCPMYFHCVNCLFISRLCVCVNFSILYLEMCAIL